MPFDIQARLATAGLETTAGGDEGIVVQLRRAGRLVVRVDTDQRPVVVKASEDGGAFRAEETAIRRLTGNGLPVATVLAHTVGPPAYLVLTWIDGDGLISAHPVPAQRDAGRLLRKIHQIQLDDTDHFAAGAPTWTAWMAGWLNTALAWLADVAPPGEDRAAAAWRWFGELEPLLDGRDGALILFDGRPEHLLVAGDAVAGIIDVAELRVGDPAMDLGVLAVPDPALLPNVLDGYQPDHDERAVLNQLVPFYTFLRRVSWATWTEHNSPDEFRQALSWATATQIPG